MLTRLSDWISNPMCYAGCTTLDEKKGYIYILDEKKKYQKLMRDRGQWWELMRKNQHRKNYKWTSETVLISINKLEAVINNVRWL